MVYPWSKQHNWSIIYIIGSLQVWVYLMMLLHLFISDGLWHFNWWHDRSPHMETPNTVRAVWFKSHLQAKRAGITQSTRIFGRKIVLDQPCRALWPRSPQINICAYFYFISEVNTPLVQPWWLTNGSHLMPLLAQQCGKLVTYSPPNHCS